MADKYIDIYKRDEFDFIAEAIKNKIKQTKEDEKELEVDYICLLSLYIKENKISVKNISEKTGVNSRNIFYYSENMRTCKSYSTRHKIAKAINLSHDQLWYYAEEEIKEFFAVIEESCGLKCHKIDRKNHAGTQLKLSEREIDEKGMQSLAKSIKLKYEVEIGDWPIVKIWSHVCRKYYLDKIKNSL